GLRLDNRAVRALHGVGETIARRMGDELARLAGDLAVDEDVGADLVVIPAVVGGVLEVPVHLPGLGFIGDDAVGVEVVARPRVGVHHRHRIAGAPESLVADGIIGAGHPDCTAAAAPGIVGVLPGFAAGLAGGGDRVFK